MQHKIYILHALGFHKKKVLWKLLPLLFVKEAVDDLEAADEFEAKGGSLSTESPVVRRRCLDEFFAAPFVRVLAASGASGGNGEATTLTTGGEAAGTAFMSTVRPSKTTTNSPTFWLEDGDDE